LFLEFYATISWSWNINVDINNDDGKTKFDNYTRFIALIFIIIESIILIVSGNISPNIFLGIDPIILYIILFLQLFIGGMLYYY
jgi:hypothetical protein